MSFLKHMKRTEPYTMQDLKNIDGWEGIWFVNLSQNPNIIYNVPIC